MSSPAAGIGRLLVYTACCIFFILFIQVFSGCSSVPVHSGEYGSSAVSLKDRTFYKTQLSNGIPVVIRENGSGDPCLLLVIDGGASLVPARLSGVERLLFSLIQHCFTAAPVKTDVCADYSVFGFSAVNMEKLLPDFADSFLHPDFSGELVETARSEVLQRYHIERSESSARFAGNVRDLLYRGHPYWSLAGATGDSLQKISLEDIVKYHDGLVNAARLKIIVVGGFSESDEAGLVQLLEQSFGRIPSVPYFRPDIPPVAVSNGTTVFPSDASGDGYVLGCFTVPAYSNADYVPFALAGLLFDDMLHHALVERNRIAESAGVGMFGARVPVGVISVYRTTDTAVSRTLVSDLISQFPGESDIEKVLAGYKKNYGSMIVLSAENAAGEAERLAAAIEYTGSTATAADRAALVQSVTASQVEQAFRTYIEENAIHWFTVN